MPRQSKTANQLTPTEAAYLAGIVDGEGCISAHLNRGYLAGNLEIGSVNRDFLISLKNLAGTGALHAHGRRSKNAKILYRWRIQLKVLPSLLNQLMPYLRLKQAQAQLMISLATYSKFPSVINRKDRFQLNAIEQFRSLNRRGESITCN